MKKIALLFRKKNIVRNSIERVYKPLESFPLINRLEMPCDLKSMSNALRLIRFAFKIKEEFIHITGDVHYMAIFLFWKPIILVIHDCNHYESLNGIRKAVLGLIWFKFPMGIAKKVVVISPYVKNQLQSHFKINDDKIMVIPNSFYPIKKKDSYIINTPFVILAIGTKQNKNLIRLFEAAKDINDIKLNIIGHLTIELIECLEKYEINYVNSFNISKKELEQNYISSNLLFFASTKEGFGLPILEAQSCGLPVITSNTTAMPYVAGKGACIVDPYNTGDIKNAIIKVRTDPTYRQQIIDAGFLNFQRFSENLFLQSYLSLYNNTFKITIL
tara:strand:- start:12852 stop:13841 length:990 start_codon:yes stop_codon:yes gene_type:complete